jgi:hypothetical protein
MEAQDLYFTLLFEIGWFNTWLLVASVGFSGLVTMIANKEARKE